MRWRGDGWLFRHTRRNIPLNIIGSRHKAHLSRTGDPQDRTPRPPRCGELSWVPGLSNARKSGRKPAPTNEKRFRLQRMRAISITIRKITKEEKKEADQELHGKKKKSQLPLCETQTRGYTKTESNRTMKIKKKSVRFSLFRSDIPSRCFFFFDLGKEGRKKGRNAQRSFYLFCRAPLVIDAKTMHKKKTN